MSDIPDEILRHWDVVVVGAGVAGAVAAAALARSGAEVLLVERMHFPRYKVCGCCLNLRAVRLLRQLGIEPRLERAGAVPLREFRLFARGSSARVPMPGGCVLSRERFDVALCDAAREAGATFLSGVRAQFHAMCPDGLSLALISPSGNLRVHTSVVVCADGLQGSFLRDATLAPVRVPRRSRVGMGVVLPAGSYPLEPGSIHMACGKGGYVGLVALEDGRINLAAALDAAPVRFDGPEGTVGSILAKAGLPLPAGLESAIWKGTPPLTRCRDGSRRRLFFVGDAAGYVEPFTGEGMAWAIEGGMAVAGHVKALLEGGTGEEAAWQRNWRRIVGRRQWTCRGLSWLLRHPPLMGGVIHSLQVCPALARPVLQRLNQPVSERST